MAKRNAKLVVGVSVECHRAVIVGPCAVFFAYVFGHRAQVGAVNGLPNVASQLVFSCQSLAQNAVGTFEVAQGHVDVSQSIERFHIVFSGQPTRVATLFRQSQCLIVVGLGGIQHAQSAVVGADIVQCEHPFDGVAHGFGLLQTLTMHA